MKATKYIIKLSDRERAELEKHIKSKAKKVKEASRTRAKIILYLDVNGTNPLSAEETAKKVKRHLENIYLIRKQYINEGIERIINRKKREMPPVPAKVTGEVEAHIIAAACSKPPEGKSRWTMQMIADKMILDGVIESISDTTVQRTLKKRNISLI